MVYKMNATIYFLEKADYSNVEREVTLKQLI